MLLSLLLESQKQKCHATFPPAGEPEAEMSCYFPSCWRARSRNLLLLSLQLENWKQKSRATFPLGGEPEAEIMSYFSFTWAKIRNTVSCYFPFSWRVIKRNLVILSLQKENQKQKSLDTLPLENRKFCGNKEQIKCARNLELH
jgi:hypothetical protein